MSGEIMKRNGGNYRPATFETVVDNMFRNSLDRFFNDDFWSANRGQSLSKVPVNVRENKDNYELDVVAPGCKKEDFKVELQDNLLTISFEHKEESKDQGRDGNWVRNEYRKQSFSRSFTLDDSVAADQIDASYQDGILKLVLPKNEKALSKKSRNIEIK